MPCIPRISHAVTSLCLSLLVVLGLATTGMLVPALASAQERPGVETSNYGYVSPDASVGIVLGHLEADDPSLASQLVSPQYADDIFSGFSIFTDYDFARDLNPAYRNQVDDANEYMVFSGDLDFYNGVRLGYTILLSASQQVFLLAGYQTDADDLFDLAAQTIAEGAPPEEFGDFTRFDLDDSSLDAQDSQ